MKEDKFEMPAEESMELDIFSDMPEDEGSEEVAESSVDLSEASDDDLLAELKSRGFEVEDIEDAPEDEEAPEEESPELPM